MLTLPELHHIIGNIWLTRFDEELEQEQTARRKGRPKSTKEVKIEEVKRREDDEYRTGLGMWTLHTSTHSLMFLFAEIIDLTHPANVEIFRKWDQKELAYMQLLRFIRITSTKPEVAVVSKPGKHVLITGSLASSVMGDGENMNIVNE